MKLKNYLILLIVLSVLYLLQFTYFDYKYSSDLSRLENEVKHNIDRVNSTLSTFGSQLDSVERRSFVNIHKIPLPVVFCGDTLDYSNQLIREKLEREFYSLLGEQGQIQLYLKRSAKYFPMIERHLNHANLPDDLKFLAVHESALLPNIRSRSNAVGLWQFMRQTGQLYKLKINRYIDERRDPEKATMAAIKMLKDLYNIFESWPLVLAAYNGGFGRVRSSIKKNNSMSFVDLSLPEETKRYYFKIIVAKIILSQPEEFGYKFLENDYFRNPDNDEIHFTISKHRMSLTDIARVCGLTIAQFKTYNPQIISSYLPQGLYSIKIPAENYAVYLDNNYRKLEERGISFIRSGEDVHFSE